jgi:hypothetical protein
MNKLKTIFLISIFNILSFSLFCQFSFEATGDSLNQKGLYAAALKEYLRSEFLGEKGISSDINLKISDLFLKTENIAKALEYLDAHYYLHFNDQNERNRVLYKKTQVLLGIYKYDEAILNVLQIKTNNIEELNKSNFYKGILYVLLKNDAKSLESFSKLSYINEKDIIHIESLIKNTIKDSKKKSQIASIQSALIPGLGQSINGDLSDGLKSFFVVGALATLFIDVSLSYSLVDALVSVGPWLSRYYIGGIANANKTASLKKKYDFNDSIKELTEYILYCKELNKNILKR